MIQDSSDDEDGAGKSSPVSTQLGNSNVEALSNSSIFDNSIIPYKQESEQDQSSCSLADLPNQANEKLFIEKTTKEESEALEIENRKCLQIYVFVARCIAYPFSAKYRYDMTYRPPKMTMAPLQLASDRFLSFLQGDLKIPYDGAFLSVVRNFYEVVLKSDEISDIVNGPGWTMIDFSEVFKKNVQKCLSSLPEIEGISKSTLLNNWMEKFELIFRGESDQRKLPLIPSIFNSVDTKMTKDQLFDLFQKILHVKKHQHQILFNSLQLDNSDEQAAQVRRELDYRMQEVYELQKNNNMDRCLTKEMDKYFAEELRLSIEHLKVSLQGVPVSKEDDDCKEFCAYQMDASKDHEVSKHDLLLSFRVQVMIKDVSGLTSIDKNKILFCLFEMDGCDKLSTNRTEAANLSWDVQADFVTNSPLPHLKIRLCQENSSLLSFDDKELAKLSLTLKLSNNPMPAAEWHKMQVAKNLQDKDLNVKLIPIIEKPKNVKSFGFLYCQGKTMWKKWKKRYFLLIQVSQFTFLMCSYQENKPEPTDSLSMNDFTLDHCDKVPGLDGGHSYFMLTKEGDEVIFSTEDEDTLLPWMQALYRATGQTFKPQLPSETHRPSSLLFKSESERTCRKLFDEVAQACPSKQDHHDLFQTLQKLTVEFRIKDPFICTYGWLSSDQIFVLDEYCARYGVRVFMRHLGYLEVLMDHAYDKIYIDPSLLYQKFSFCVAHIHGNKPDRTYTVLKEEKKRFMEVSYKLVKYLEHVITNFRLSFPFGRPDDGLKISLSLLERVLREINYFERTCQLESCDTFKLKEILKPVPEQQMYDVIKKCIDQSTFHAYILITRNCNLEGTLNGDDIKSLKEAFMMVAENCIQTLQQITEYHADAFVSYNNLVNENAHLLWSMFFTDLHHFIHSCPLGPDMWNFFSLFQLINEYCLSQKVLHNGNFHKDLCSLFAPIVIHYLDSMELSICQSLGVSFNEYIWKPADKDCLSIVKDLLWKLDSLGNFIYDLNWPDEIFFEHLKSRLASINYQMVTTCTSKNFNNFEHILKHSKKPNDCLLSEEIFTTLNTTAKLLDSFSQNSIISKHLTEILEKMVSSFILRLLIELDDILSEISKYDASKYFMSIFAFKKPEQLARPYIEFLQLSLLQIRRNIVDETFLQTVLKAFFSIQVKKLVDWLTERIDMRLPSQQLQTLTTIWNKLSEIISESQIKEDLIKTQDYKRVSMRLEMEGII